MTSTRRPLTPRAALAKEFDQFQATMAALLTGQNVSQGTRSHIDDRLASLRAQVLRSADAAPPVDPLAAMKLVEKGNGFIEKFVRRHLEREIPLLDLGLTEPADTNRLVDRIMQGLAGFAPLNEVAQVALEAFPRIEAREQCAWHLESVIREAIGLDGRVPEPDSNQDVSAWVAMSLRMALQGDTPNPHATRAPRAGIDESDLDAALTVLCLPDDQSGAMRDEIYHVAMHNIARDTLSRIEAVAGGPLDPDVAQVIEEVIRRAGATAGPKVEIIEEAALAP